MNFDLVSIAVLFFCFLNTFKTVSTNPTGFTNTDDVSIDCGSGATSAARGGREWHGDAQKKFSSLLQIKGSSTTSTVIHKLTSADDPVPYKTARISSHRFSYAFQVNPGTIFIRIYFSKGPYKGFKNLKDLFTVEAGPFTLLSNFSASLTADALGLKSFAKEFYINIRETQQLSIVFTPEISQSLDTYTFVNGIEIISVISGPSYFHGGDFSVQVVGKSLVYVDNSTALEAIHRLDVKQDSSLSAKDTGRVSGMWGTAPKRKGNMINNVTWRIPVDVGFRYLVRLHFSELGFKMAEIGGFVFKVWINDGIADTNIEIFGESDENSIPCYRDHVVMMKGSRQEGRRDLLIVLESNDEFMDGHGPLKGFEVMKLSNLENSLASPNPLPLVTKSSRGTIQHLVQVLGRRNVIASVAITVLALVNITVYVSRLIWEARGADGKIMPSAKAERLCRRFSLAEIRSATRDFSDGNVIGRGGFGKVYKGIIDKGRETVAIKRQKSNSKQGAREFLTEIETLTELRHVNLVPLIGYCNEHKEMILVYEYMACGTLADHLSKQGRNGNNNSSLTWKQRLNICIGAGQGMDYLHTGHSLIHRDLKTSNILLDENFVPKVADFGLAKSLSKHKLQSHVSTKVKGTFGYFDPKYLITGKLTRESDTYAFGVVLLEVLSGRRAMDPGAAQDEQMLTKWAQENISKGNGGLIVDSSLRDEISQDSLKVFLEVAERCLHDEPKKRPTMAEVVLQLKFALKMQESPKSPESKLIHHENDIGSLNIETKSPVSRGKSALGLSLFRGRGFNSTKCKKQLKSAAERVKLVRNRREVVIWQMRRDIAMLLQSGQNATALFRVEHIIKEQNIMAAYQLIELFCELVAARCSVIAKNRECPADFKEGISSLIFAAARCSEIPELLSLRDIFQKKYGKDFVSAASDLQPNAGVSRILIEKLSVKTPSGEIKSKVLKEIAYEHNVEWDRTESEEQLLKPPEEGIEGPNNFVSATTLPLKPDEKSSPAPSNGFRGLNNMMIFQDPCSAARVAAKEANADAEAAAAEAAAVLAACGGKQKSASNPGVDDVNTIFQTSSGKLMHNSFPYSQSEYASGYEYDDHRIMKTNSSEYFHYFSTSSEQSFDEGREGLRTLSFNESDCEEEVEVEEPPRRKINRMHSYTPAQSNIRFDESGDDDGDTQEWRQPTFTRDAHQPLDQPAPQVPPVHHKLPDYDTFVARFRTLRRLRDMQLDYDTVAAPDYDTLADRFEALKHHSVQPDYDPLAARLEALKHLSFQSDYDPLAARFEALKHHDVQLDHETLAARFEALKRHNTLPDYDTLVARFEALKHHKTQKE